jgi:hypothetical protein
MSDIKIDMETAREHADSIRLVGAGLCQVLAFVLIINSSGFIYGGKETFTVLFMLAASVLAGWSLYGFLRPKEAAEPPKPVHERMP